MGKVQYYPLDPAAMARGCRKAAADMRREAALGWPPILLCTGPSDDWRHNTISRADAAASMDRNAERWEEEVRTGRPNVIGRKAIGF